MPQIPFAFQWTIFKNELLPLKDSNDGHLRSKSVTNIPELGYYLTLFPNELRDESVKETWIYLHLKFKNAIKVESDYTITIESANISDTHDRRLYEGSDEGWGTCICNTDELHDSKKKYFVDEKLTVKVNGIFKFGDDINAAISGQQRQKWDGEEFGNQFWKYNETKDFTIIVEEKEIKVHKIVLEMQSEVFAAMFNSNMKEAIENKMIIPDIPFSVVETGIKLIYHCNSVAALSMEELISLLQFFDKYDLPSIKAKVEPYLIDQISATTVVRLTNASILTNSFKLKDKCIEFLMVCFESKTPFHDIDNLDKDVALQILKNSVYRIVKTEK